MLALRQRKGPRVKETLEEMQRRHEEVQDKLKHASQQERVTLTREANQALEERDRARKAFDLAREELGMTRVEVDRLKTTIDGALHEREELLREISAKEEQLRQRDQGHRGLRKTNRRTKRNLK